MAKEISQCTLGATGISTTALGIGGFIGGLTDPNATAAEVLEALVTVT